MKTAVITGTTSGIGLATSVKFAEQGYKVFAGMRNLAKADPLSQVAAEKGLDIEPFEMDVCQPDSVSQAFESIQANHDIDVLVNNAGIAGAAPLEFTSEEAHKNIFETNYFGAVRCIQAVVGGMRERGSGGIANISSAAGLVASPNQVAYSASKWAVECMGESLAHELASFGVRVVNIEPNVVLTEIFKNSADKTYFDPTSPYINLLKRSSKLFSAGMRSPATVDQVADAVYTALTGPKYQLRWPVGESAQKMYDVRQTMSSDDWVALGGVSDDQEYVAGFKKIFGINLEK